MDAIAGTLQFNGVNTTGAEGIVEILGASFEVLSGPGTNLEVALEFSAMAAALTVSAGAAGTGCALRRRVLHSGYPL